MKKLITIILILSIFAAVFAEDNLLEKARKLSSEGVLGDAVSVYTQIIESGSKYQIDALYERGQIYFRQKKFREAVGDFTFVLQLDKTNARAMTAKGAVYEALGQPEKALAEYNLVTEINPDYPYVYLSRCRLYLKEQNFESAASDCDKAVELQDSNKQAYFVRGWVNMGMNKKYEAMQDFETFMLLGGYEEPVAGSVQKLINSIKGVK